MHRFIALPREVTRYELHHLVRVSIQTQLRLNEEAANVIIRRSG